MMKNKWIDINEELPPIGVNLLISYEYKGQRLWSKHSFIDDENYLKQEIEQFPNKMTHWMLIETPAEQERECKNDLRDLRKKCSKTIGDTCRHMGWTKSYLMDLEFNRIPEPHGDQMQRLYEFYAEPVKLNILYLLSPSQLCPWGKCKHGWVTADHGICGLDANNDIQDPDCPHFEKHILCRG